MVMKEYFTISEVADLLGVSKETLRRWDNNDKLKATRHPINNYRVYSKEQLKAFDKLHFLFNSDKANDNPKANHNYNSIELFAGAGGMALGLEKAGLNCTFLNEIDHWACETLRTNRPNWSVIEDDVSKLDFSDYKGKIDVVTGGFPCQAFSYAGKKMGFNDARGTLFYEFARVVNEVKPLICVGENVRGLLRHDNGNTINGMKSVLEELGYRVLNPTVLKALYFNVPQKRERLFLVGIREDIETEFLFPKPYKRQYNLRDALKKGDLYNCDVPESQGSQYPARKKEILDLVPPGGYWRDLPLKIQKEYMQKSFYLGGGKTGMARRISWEEPSLTLTCSPAQKQTERCHPEETRPFTIREYARIQTFPDSWMFSGSVSNQYKQIGNAVPVNLAKEIGHSIISFLNKAYKEYNLENKIINSNQKIMEFEEAES
ncbi:DNA (cytosine-5-)-methyltransferase [Salegentibacter sp. UBA1130]|uniref:DNA (cytosine-5-)-methyltransferase n=1 Tax=Salegentibacter sp. UBA1130 TaxID=1947451 RepID=UPI00257EAF9C|nr:DNA (cytosine-5-)-methyltransferase [Salegentibacter sp. UBA1130]